MVNKLAASIQLSATEQELFALLKEVRVAQASRAVCSCRQASTACTAGASQHWEYGMLQSCCA